MKHTEMSAVQCLTRNGAKVGGVTITTRGTVGLKMLSAIDCLVNHHNFHWVRSKESKHKREDNV